MMMNLLKYTLLIFLLSFAACSSEDDAVPTVPNGQPQPGDVLELTVSAADFVTDGAPDTRATNNDKTTTFEDGDRVGIIILDENSHLIYDNIPYEYNSGNWTFDSNNDEGKGECYYDPKATTFIVYYPYSRAADEVTGLNDLKARFAPKFNQSDIEDYRSSDLMVWSRPNEHLASSVTTLDAVLEHAFASVYLTPTAYTLDDGNDTKGNIKVSDVSLTIGDNVYIPYQATDGSLRCIVPASINPSGIRCFYTFSDIIYGNTITIQDAVTSNTRYTSAPEIISGKYTLADAKVGDFYCKNSDNKGYLIPSDVALTDEQKKACIGIVCSTNINRIGNEAKKVLKDNGVTNPHGLVMALTNASDGCRWGEENKDENTDGAAGTPFKDNTYTLKQKYNNIDGYTETHWILNQYNATLVSIYSAFYHASRYGTKEGGTSQYAAPNTTTGWFIPSMGQWWDILSNLGGIDLRVYQENNVNRVAYISGKAPIVVGNMNRYLEEITDATRFSTDVHDIYFWSSSESDSTYACAVGFESDDDLYLGAYTKHGDNPKLRCIFAF